MHPIKEFKFDTITPDLKEEYFKIHNQIFDDLSLLSNNINNVDCENYINIFLSRFNKAILSKNTILETIIGCERNILISIYDETDRKTLNTLFKVAFMQSFTFFSTAIGNELDKRIKLDKNAEISFKDILLKVFDYEGNREQLLKYYSSQNYSVCSYCLVQNTVIYESKSTEKHYLMGNLDHVKPKDKNPLLSISINNLIPVCAPCNQRKGNTEFIYDPFNSAHTHSFDFNKCIDYDEDRGEVVYKSLKELKITADDDKYMDMSKKLDYIDLYSNFNCNAQIMIDRYKKFKSDGYSEHLNQIIDSTNPIEFIEYLISEVPLTEENILKFPLTKFKMELFNTIKSKSSTT